MRNFVTRFALVLCVVGALAALAGSVDRAGASPQAGSTLTIGLSTDPDTLDPTLDHTLVGRLVLLYMCSKLYDMNAQGQIVPQIAAALPQVSKNRLTDTIKIRPGLKFNDGTPLTAAAVKETLVRAQTLPGSQRATDVSPITSIQTVGATTVILHLKTPDSALTSALADRAGAIMSPTALAKEGSNFGANPVCSGPFMFKDRVPNDHITLVKSPYYWQKQQVHLSSIIFKPMPDPNARIQALKAGDIQIAQGIQPDYVPAMEGNKNIHIIKAVLLASTEMPINVGNKSGVVAPYANVGTPLAQSADLRQAWSLAIDRVTLNKVVYGGLSEPGCFPLPPTSAWYKPTTKGIPCDLHANLARAQQLVKASGFSTPITVHLLAMSTDSRLAQVIQSMEQQAGFNVVIDLQDFATWVNDLNTGKFDVSVFAGQSGAPDPDYAYYSNVWDPGIVNWDGYSNPQVLRDLQYARIVTSTASRSTYYNAALKILQTDQPIVYIGYPADYTGVSTSVTGVQEYGDGMVRAMFAQMH